VRREPAGNGSRDMPPPAAAGGPAGIPAAAAGGTRGDWDPGARSPEPPIAAAAAAFLK